MTLTQNAPRTVTARLQASITGDIEERIRLPGAIELVRPGIGSMSCMQLFSSIPVPGTVTFATIDFDR